MIGLFKKNYVYYLIFLPVYILSGMLGAVAPLAVGIVGIVWFTVKKRYELIVLTFVFTVIIASSKAHLFAGFDMLRAIFVLYMLGFSLIIMKREGRIRKRITYFLPFFIVALIVSFLFSPRLINSILSLLAYLFLVISVFIFVTHVMQQTKLQLYEHLILLFVLVTIISLLGGYILFPTAFIEGGRLRGLTGNPNALSLFIIIAYPFLDYYNSQKGSISEKGIMIGKGLLLLCLFFTGSRTGYTSIIIYTLLTIFLFRGISGISVAIVVGLMAILVLFQVEMVINIFPGLKDIIRPESLESATGRLPSWLVAIEQISRQPWLGGGYQFSTYYMPHFAQSHGFTAVSWYGVWNSYLSFLMDVGIIGLATYGFFVFALIKISLRPKMLSPFLGIVLFSAIFESWLIAAFGVATPLFLIFFVINHEYESRYKYLSVV